MSIKNLLTSQSKPDLNLNVNSLNSSSGLSVGTLVATGDVNCVNANVTSDVQCATVTASGDLTSLSDVQCVNLDLTGNLNATGDLIGNASFITNNVSCIDMTATGDMTCNNLFVQSNLNFTNGSETANLLGSSGTSVAVSSSRFRINCLNVPETANNVSFNFVMTNLAFSPSRIYFLTGCNSGSISVNQLLFVVDNSVSGQVTVTVTNKSGASISVGSTGNLLIDFMGV